MRLLLCTLALLLIMQPIIAQDSKIAINGKEVKFKVLVSKNEIQTATEIRTLLTELIKNISSCMKSGNTNDSCNCKYKNKSQKLNTLVTEALKIHPQWLETKAIKFKLNGSNATLYMQGLQKQTSKELQC